MSIRGILHESPEYIDFFVVNHEADFDGVRSQTTHSPTAKKGEEEETPETNYPIRLISKTIGNDSISDDTAQVARGRRSQDISSHVVLLSFEMPSLSTLAVLALFCATALSHASILPIQLADKNLDRRAAYEAWSANDILPSSLKSKRQADPTAVITLDWQPTKTYIKLTRIFSGDPAAEKNIPGLQSELSNLVNDATSFVGRQTDEVIHPPDQDPAKTLCGKPIYKKCNPLGNYKLSVQNAQTCYRTPFASVFSNVPAQKYGGNEITWGVLHVALQILHRHMTADTYGFTQATFEVWDGENQVGSAEVKAVSDNSECVFH
ncbi:MAG: hypothetical protein Q9169_001948 [Polycauliona sp. 2 TL-2023]